MEPTQSKDIDLDRTDKLPVLTELFDPDLTDDALHIDYGRVAPSEALVAAGGATNDFSRHPSVDLPSLAESVRSVEERIARQSADYEALKHSFETAQAAESAAIARAQMLEKDLAAAHGVLAERAQAAAQSEAELRADLAAAKAQADSHLELLRTRDWRSGFEQNLFREMDARVGAADSGRDALAAQRDQLQAQLATFEARISEKNAAIDKLQTAAAAQAASVAQQAQAVLQAAQLRAEWTAKLALADSEAVRLRAEIAARDQALADARTAAAADRQSIEQLRAEAATRDEEMTVLMAHLQEARRPLESPEREIKRLRDDIALKSLAIEELTQEGERVRAVLERTRGQLEEREFLIRRLERTESNNASALGRIQTSMERLGSATTSGPSATASGTVSAAATGTVTGSIATTGVTGSIATAIGVQDRKPELIRIDGDRSVTHSLQRRTRIGRAPGCEMQIDSSSVSRHHALVLAGLREVLIEDLNSTNGVIVNGRKVTRQVLSDGDIVTIGEIQFRFVAKPTPPPERASNPP